MRRDIGGLLLTHYASPNTEFLTLPYKSTDIYASYSRLPGPAELHARIAELTRQAIPAPAELPAPRQEAETRAEPPTDTGWLSGIVTKVQYDKGTTWYALASSQGQTFFIPNSVIRQLDRRLKVKELVEIKLKPSTDPKNNSVHEVRYESRELG